MPVATLDKTVVEYQLEREVEEEIALTVVEDCPTCIDGVCQCAVIIPKRPA